MKLTSKTLYSLNFLTALAIKEKEPPVKPTHLREISTQFQIPFKFLEQIAILMKSVGLVKGARGKGGGYLLCEDPKEISLNRILQAAEGDFLPRADISGGNEAVNNHVDRILQGARVLLANKMEEITLAELAENALSSREAYMYYL